MTYSYNDEELYYFMDEEFNMEPLMKDQVEDALKLKADASSVYIKEEVNTILADYAKTADVPSIKVNAAATADKVANSLTVGNKTFDGSAAVEVTAADLGLEKRTVDGCFTSGIQRKNLGHRVPAEVELEDGSHKSVKFLVLNDAGLAFDPTAADAE